MAVTYSEMIELGTQAPDFDLPIVNPKVDRHGSGSRSLEDYRGSKAVVVVFMCNHCPYVKTIEDRLIGVAIDYEPAGVQFIGICSNDDEAYPDDSFENMALRAREKGYPFPYLRDDSQDVARAYGAVCTPDFFMFDDEGLLVYRGRLDDGRPGQQPTTRDLRDALDEFLNSGQVSREQIPSMGCNIKWK